MGAKFELHTRPTRELADPVGRHQVLRSDRCVSCGACLRACIYGVHERDPEDPRQLAEPRSALCRACAVCPQQCPRRALQLRCNPALDAIGTAPFDADAVLTAWSEALEGKIPVRGAGYGGLFSGSGFDGIWTDMSEIVRPTRDGIHGREYISTEFDLGRKLPDLCGLRFDGHGRLLDHIPLTREIPVPVLFGRSALGPQSVRLTAVLLRAAMELQTFALLDPAQLQSLPTGQNAHDERARRYLIENRNHAACHLGQASVGALETTASVVELADGSDLADRLLRLTIDVGGEPRQIVAGIALFYSPEELVGRTLVVVANLAPAKIRGVESRGMLLAAKKGKRLRLVTVDGEAGSGWRVG